MRKVSNIKILIGTKSFEVNGIKFEKEKIYLINEDRVDEYTKQLEYQLKEKDKKITELENMLNLY